MFLLSAETTAAAMAWGDVGLTGLHVLLWILLLCALH